MTQTAKYFLDPNQERWSITEKISTLLSQTKFVGLWEDLIAYVNTKMTLAIHRYNKNINVQTYNMVISELENQIRDDMREDELRWWKLRWLNQHFLISIIFH